MRIALSAGKRPSSVNWLAWMRREMTPAEALLWQHIRANRLDGFHFRRQVVIEGFIVDFYCPNRSLIIEVDGDIHDLQPEYDKERTQILSQQGLRVIRFHNDEVSQTVTAVIRSIRAALRDIPPRSSES